MAFRFHKRFKIAPGLTLNLNKKSVSLRAGVQNAGITVGTKGKTVSASVPQTGLSVQKKLPSGAKTSTDKASKTTSNRSKRTVEDDADGGGFIINLIVAAIVIGTAAGLWIVMF